MSYYRTKLNHSVKRLPLDYTLHKEVREVAAVVRGTECDNCNDEIFLLQKFYVYGHQNKGEHVHLVFCPFPSYPVFLLYHSLSSLHLLYMSVFFCIFY